MFRRHLRRQEAHLQYLGADEFGNHCIVRNSAFSGPFLQLRHIVEFSLLSSIFSRFASFFKCSRFVNSAKCLSKILTWYFLHCDEGFPRHNAYFIWRSLVSVFDCRLNRSFSITISGKWNISRYSAKSLTGKPHYFDELTDRSQCNFGMYSKIQCVNSTIFRQFRVFGR